MKTPSRLLLLFLAMNIFNYVDREVLAGVFPLLKHQFLLSDAALGWLGSAFMITYSLVAIPFGLWSDRWVPTKVAAVGVAVWSLASMSSALAWSFGSLFVLRALIGVGEAAYTSTAGTILSQAYPENRRSYILGLLNLGMPIGGAVGVIAGGYVGVRFGWQAAFLLVGIPGLVLAWLSWRLPVRKVTTSRETPRFDLRQATRLFRNPAFVWTSLGYAGISFAFGAIVWFAPTFFQRYFGYSLPHATLVAGALQVSAGVLGAPIGGWVADRWHRRHSRGRAYTLALAMVASAACLGLGLYVHSLALFFLSAFFMLWHVGVAASVIFDVVDVQWWNTAAATAIFVMHLLGDVWSPPIVGFISDRTNLWTSFSTLTVPMLFAGLCFWVAARFIAKRVTI